MSGGDYANGAEKARSGLKRQACTRRDCATTNCLNGAKQMYTTQKQIRKAFWQAAKAGEFLPLRVTPKKIANYSGNGRMHTTDTRCCFVDWLDMLSKSGEVSEKLAYRATL